MLDKGVLKVLVCPMDHMPLSTADSRIIAKLNRAIAAGQVKNRAGEVVKEQLTGGLIRADKTFLYPIIDGIPVMLVDEAIPLDRDG